MRWGKNIKNKKRQPFKEKQPTLQQECMNGNYTL
jgi:hypothetical protein